MNPNPATKAPTDLLYGFPRAHWTIPADRMTPFIGRLYAEALTAISDPASDTARLWAAELEEEGYKVLTQNLTLPQVVSLVSELPQRTIVRLTGRAPGDGTRQEVVRMLYTEPED